MLKRFALAALALMCAATTDAYAQKKKSQEWVDGVTYTTDWDTAIKAVQQSGKMLFIYNGWERKGI